MFSRWFSPFSLPKTLRGRMMAILGFGWASVLVLFVIVVVVFVYQSETISWRGREAEAARNAANVVDAYISRVISSLELVSTLGIDEITTNPEEIELVINRTPSIIEIVYLHPDGTVVASLGGSRPVLANQFTIAQAEWFVAARNGHKYFSRVQVSASNEPYMIVSAPAGQGDVIAARIKMDILWQVVEDIRFGEQGGAYVINREGRVMAYTARDVVLENRLMPDMNLLPLILHAPGNQYFGRSHNFAGQTVVSATAPIGTTGWIVVTELPWQEAFANTIKAIILLPVILMILGLFVIWMVGRLMDRLLIQPIDQLSVGAEHIGQGDLRYRISIPRMDELGQVMQRFNQMAEKLDEQRLIVERELQERKRAEAALNKLNDELEERVASRTEQLSLSLKEKDVLLKEVHHRVKNNLQIISSMLSLQLRSVHDPITQGMLQDSQSRVRSMALIHEKLYQSESLEMVDLGDYIQTLAGYLLESYSGQGKHITFDINADPVMLTLNQAVPCGLLLNEMITNALKHAFNDKSECLVSVELRETPERMIKLRVADNGVGLPAGLNIETIPSLGMQLIRSISMQLEGELEINAEKGTEYILTFKGEN